MRSLFFILTALSVMGLAVWAYRENYRTQAALSEVAALNDEIADLRESASVLRAEGAYLNRPTRLHELAVINYDRLGLMPLAPEQFGLLGDVAFPQDDLGPILEPVDTIGEEAKP